MNIAKKALEQFCKDGKYIKVVEVSEAEVLFKGKDFDKAWEYATCVLVLCMFCMKRDMKKIQLKTIQAITLKA